jgi:quinol monooxygenase YgiN
MVTVMWDMRVRPDAKDEAQTIIKRIWSDMRTLFQGYISHRLFMDADQPGHFIVVSDWASRADADRVRDEYANSEPVARLQPLLSEPRRRLVLSELR